jgi:hypothetical protein
LPQSFPALLYKLLGQEWLGDPAMGTTVCIELSSIQHTHNRLDFTYSDTSNAHLKFSAVCSKTLLRRSTAAPQVPPAAQAVFACAVCGP